MSALENPKGNAQSSYFSCYTFLCLWEGKAKGVWQGWLWLFLSAALGRKLHFHSLSPFQKQLPSPRSATWRLSARYLLGAQVQMCLRSPPQTMWNSWEKTAKGELGRSQGNCTKPRSYIFPQFPWLVWILCLNFSGNLAAIFCLIRTKCRLHFNSINSLNGIISSVQRYSATFTLVPLT